MLVVLFFSNKIEWCTDLNEIVSFQGSFCFGRFFKNFANEGTVVGFRFLKGAAGGICIFWEEVKFCDPLETCYGESICLRRFY